MSRDSTPNYFKTAGLIERALALATKGMHAQALAELTCLDREDLLGVPEVQQSLDMALIKLQGARNAGDAIERLQDGQAQVTAMLPRFRIVLINETANWREDIAAQTGKIWSAYLYDENRKVHIADMSPSYEMTYIDCTAENEVSDELRDVLTQDGDGGDASLIMYCRDVDRIGWDKKHFCGQPSDLNAEDYASLVESELEYYKGNSCIDLPRTPDVKMLLEAALQTCSAGDTDGAIAALLAATEAQQDPDTKTQFEQVLAALARRDLGDRPLASTACTMIDSLVRAGASKHANDTDEMPGVPTP